MGVNIDIPPGSPFTIDNIPFGVIKTSTGPKQTPRIATAIGDYAIDLAAYASETKLKGLSLDYDAFADALQQPTLNSFAALPRPMRREFRERLQKDINASSMPSSALIPLKDAEMCLPFAIGGFSDYYCSIEHVRNCQPMIPDSSRIPKNWFHSPSVYNSRTSSVVPSGTPIRRPNGIFYRPLHAADTTPTYGPSECLDFELEMGYFVSTPIAHGETMPIADAREHIFGFVLLNDWSSRDLQMFEMKPLGPFHSKGFATSISSWVVTMEALEAFSTAPKTKQDPPPFEHLAWKGDGNDGALDVKLSVTLWRKGKKYELATSNLRYLYWTPYQQLAHHASAGCGMRTGDLIGTGTVSGDGRDAKGEKTELGCLFEVTEAGTKSRELEGGEVLRFLEDGDEVVLEGWCGESNSKEGMKIGFGECRGRIVPAKN